MRPPSFEKAPVRSWRLRAEVRSQFLPRASAATGIGLIVGSIATLLGVSPLSYRASVVMAAFWSAAVLTATFRNHITRMLVWLLILDALLSLYQVVMFLEIPRGYILVRVGPALIGAAALLLACAPRPRRKSLLPVLWIAFNAFSLIPLADGLIPLLDGLLYWAVGVMNPVAFYLAAQTIRTEPWPPNHLSDILTLGITVTCAVPLILLPFELAGRDDPSISSLQYGARSYAVLGMLMLLAPAVLATAPRWSRLARAGLLMMVLTLFALSFSRGALISALLLVASIAMFGRRLRGRLFVGVSACCLAFVQVLAMFSPQLLENVRQFWLLRTNIGSNTSDDLTFTLGSFVDNDRSEILQFGIAAWHDSIIWGHGIGSTPYLFADATGDRLSYSGMHNLFVTVLAERGIVGLSILLVVICRILFLILTSKAITLDRRLVLSTLVTFLFFASTTGVELFLSSPQSMNAAVTNYLFLFAALVSRNPSSGAIGPAHCSPTGSSHATRGAMGGPAPEDANVDQPRRLP